MRERTAPIQIRATPQEKARIVRYAKRCNLTITQYLLQLANGYAPKAFPTEEFFTLCATMAQIHTALQATPAANANHILQQLQEALHALEQRFLFAPLAPLPKGGECHRDDQDMAD